MVSNILTGSQKSQLLAIQSTQRVIDRVTQNLASGKDVNNALQNPQNFFSSSALDNRASDISRLIDNINQNIKAVQESATGIEAIDSLLNQAESLLREAEIELFSENEPQPNIQLNDLSELLSYAGGQDAGGVTELDNDGKSIFLDGNLWKRIDFDYEITEHTVLRFDYQSTNVPEIAAIGFDNDNNFTNSSQFFFVHGQQFTGINYSAPALDYAYNGSGDIETIEIPIGEFFQGNFESLIFINDDDGGGDDGDSLFNNLSFYETNDVVLPLSKEERAAEYAADYNEILQQIDFIAQDANYRGINLLKSEDLISIFNEDHSSTLLTEGINATHKGLGLLDADFSRLSRVQNALATIREAKLTLREYTSSLQTNLTILTARQNFAQNIINTLESGRDDLVLADQNQEGAELLATQTRQQIQFSTLAFSAQQSNIAQFL